MLIDTDLSEKYHVGSHPRKGKVIWDVCPLVKPGHPVKSLREVKRRTVLVISHLTFCEKWQAVLEGWSVAIVGHSLRKKRLARVKKS
jgi:hypothetical protein